LGVVEQLLNHIHRHNLCKTTDKILLAVSGGIDSMVMLHLFREAGFQIGVAHCNFQLRGEDSMADEALVNQVCVENDIPFHAVRFDTLNHASSRGISTQMAARELRYEYFEELIQAQGYHYIATAHHLNDSLETTLLHFTRGTGIEGMTGIPLQQGRIIRPMLFATRAIIEDYAHQHRISWREDKSNFSDDYQRNLIRHTVVPRLRELNPNLEQTFRNTQERLHGADQLLKKFITHFREEAIRSSGTGWTIDIQKLRSQPSPQVLLWELVKEYGFNYEQCQRIISDHQPGKIFLSATYIITIDRNQFYVQRKDETSVSVFTIDSFTSGIQNESEALYFELVAKDKFQIQHHPERAQFDLEKMHYPLLWRPWKAGDSFIPLGMKHTKKLSDFLIDNKVPLPEKQQVTVLESGGTIVWVVGFRIHDHFKVTEQTRTVLTVDFRKGSE
jgi:tRNA(Ile)-lysidine synthase